MSTTGVSHEEEYEPLNTRAMKLARKYIRQMSVSGVSPDELIKRMTFDTSVIGHWIYVEQLDIMKDELPNFHLIFTIYVAMICGKSMYG